jgi:transposase
MTDKQLSESMCLQDVAMNLLATGYSLEEAAQVLGVTVGAIYNWQRRDSSFKPTVKSLRKQVDQQKPRE